MSPPAASRDFNLKLAFAIAIGERALAQADVALFVQRLRNMHGDRQMLRSGVLFNHPEQTRRNREGSMGRNTDPLRFGLLWTHRIDFLSQTFERLLDVDIRRTEYFLVRDALHTVLLH